MRKKKNAQPADLPETEALLAELRREIYRLRYFNALRSTVITLVAVAAAAVLVSTLWMPVLQIYGTSMAPTLMDGQIILSLKSGDFNRGDIVAFYYGNKLLVKRCIAGPRQWIDIEEDGDILVDGVLLEEPYLVEKAFGECDLELPYQVPDERWFMVGDHRSVSLDSRSTQVGCIAQEQIVGKIVFRVWPLQEFGFVKG